MQAEHLKAAGELRAGFRDYGYLSNMPVNFWSFFLSRVINLPEVFALVAIDVEEQKLVGYIVGTSDDTAIRKSLTSWSSFIIMVWHVLTMLTKHPEQLTTMGKIFLNREKNSVSIPPQRWITWIVDHNYKKNGIGLDLYRHLCTRMYAAGVLTFYGPVDCANDVSNMAHTKFGAKKIATIVIDNRCHYLWQHDSAKWLIK